MTDLLKNITIPLDWVGVDDESRVEYTKELKKELAPGHPLFGLEAKLLLRHKIKNNFLFYVPEGELKFAVVHLTWDKQEIPPYPSTLFFLSIQDWLDKKSIEIPEQEVKDLYEKYRIPQCVPKELVNLGIQLDKSHISVELAWKYENALQLIHILHQNQIAILGGDVYEKIGDTIDITYDNWSLDWSGGTWNEYVSASANCSIEYIEKYQKNNSGKEFLYVLVMCSSEEAYKKLVA